MSPMHQHPWRLLDDLHPGVRRRRAGRLTGGKHTATGWTPPTDVKDESTRFVIRTDIPGVDPNNIEVTTDQGMLTIRGERAAPQTGADGIYSRRERAEGAFQRRFRLPESADTARVEARCRNGVLEIVVPKRAEQQARRIPIAA
jgi:HSP20 family protein